MKVAHIPVAGDYTITTNAPEASLRFNLDGRVIPFGNPRLSFGHDNPYGFLMWIFLGLSCIFETQEGRLLLRESRLRWSGMSGADILASGQRVRGVLKSTKAIGETMRSLGRTLARPEFLDYPYYVLEVELQFPNRTPVVGRNAQPVPLTEVPNLVIGRELNCAVDPAGPASTEWIVDWSAQPPI